MFVLFKAKFETNSIMPDAGTIQGEEGGMQVLARLAPSSQTVRFNIRVIQEQANLSLSKTKAKLAPVT